MPPKVNSSTFYMQLYKSYVTKKRHQYQRIMITQQQSLLQNFVVENHLERAVVLYQGFFSTSILPWHLKKKQEYHFITLLIDKQKYR